VKETTQELIKINSGEMEQPFKWVAGTYGSKFLTEIRDNKRIWGVKCPKCGSVYVPPRRVCGPCFAEMSELVPVSDEGVIVTFTVVTFGFVDPATGLMKPVPYAYGAVRLDGANTDLIHYIDETDPSKIHIGDRVKVVFEEDGKRTGSLLDIKHFVLLNK
jgi:uncharacterized OB-fold protein